MRLNHLLKGSLVHFKAIQIISGLHAFLHPDCSAFVHTQRVFCISTLLLFRCLLSHLIACTRNAFCARTKTCARHFFIVLSAFLRLSRNISTTKLCQGKCCSTFLVQPQWTKQMELGRDMNCARVYHLSNMWEALSRTMGLIENCNF